MSNDPEDPQAKIERLECKLAQIKASRHIQSDLIARRRFKNDPAARRSFSAHPDQALQLLTSSCL